MRLGALLTAGYNRMGIEVNDAIGSGTQARNGWVLRPRVYFDYLLRIGSNMDLIIGGEISGVFGTVSFVKQFNPTIGFRFGLMI